MTHPTKTALVLAGGGLTGAVYEIGALRAMDDLLVNHTVNDFDIYVGTSAGSIVGSLLANGMSPGEIMGALAGEHSEVRPLWAGDLFTPNYGEFFTRIRRLPRTFRNALSHYARHVSDMNLWDFIWTFIEALPTGLYNGMALENYMRIILSRPGYFNDFRALTRQLYIIATDLDTGQRAVFGNDQHSHVPISLAVAASSAVPLMYKPVRIGQRDFIDGGMRGTASIDLAIENGAKLIVCINPLVPLNNARKQGIPLLGPDGTFISDRGLQAIASQVTRIMMRSGLNYHIKQLRRRHPDVDIILIEPRRDDYQMFFYNIMRYSARLLVAEHGYKSVALDLADRYSEYKEILARHDLVITRRRIIQKLHDAEETHHPETLVGIEPVEETPATTVPPSPSIADLKASLDRLTEALDRVSTQHKPTGATDNGGSNGSQSLAGARPAT